MMYTLVDDFMKQYKLSKILAAKMSRRSFGQLGTFSLHSFGVFHVYLKERRARRGADFEQEL